MSEKVLNSTLDFTSVNKGGVRLLTINTQKMTFVDTAGALLEEIQTAHQSAEKGVIVDVSRVKRMNTDGLSVLVGAHNSAKELGIGLVFICVSGVVAQLLAQSHLESVFTIASNFAAANMVFSK